MRITTKIDGQEADAALSRRASDRLRLALGSHVGDVRSLQVSLHERESGVCCEIRILLRGRRSLRFEAEAGSLEEALRFAASRAAAAVARRVNTDRILGW